MDVLKQIGSYQNKVWFNETNKYYEWMTCSSNNKFKVFDACWEVSEQNGVIISVVISYV